MAVEIVSCTLLVVVVVLWSGARRYPDASAFGPALFVAIVTAGVLVAPEADARRPLAPCALMVAMTVALIGLADVFPSFEPPGSDDDGDDHRRGGGRRRPLEPTGPRGGGGLPHPDSWEHFEEAFRAHVRTSRPERAPVHNGRRR